MQQSEVNVSILPSRIFMAITCIDSLQVVKLGSFQNDIYTFLSPSDGGN